ncbi:MAG TPA: hypothetical protein VGI54_08370, partial [Solirubrobacteraceae bacterium]
MASSSTPSVGSRVEPGSFRDPESRVFLAGDDVYRTLSTAGAEDWQALVDTGLYAALAGDGRLVRSERVDAAEVPAELGGEWAGVLRHERVPFVSYPYEWAFS